MISPIYFEIQKMKQDTFTGFSLAIDSIKDPGNLGNIIRLCDWFGVEHLYCNNGSVDFFNPKTIQASMGSLARVNCHSCDLSAFLEKYPNTIEADLKFLEQMDVDIVFIPNFEDLYQKEQKLTVNIAEIEQKMEGSKRPGHFDGVIRVLSIFFNLIKPNYAYFGEKDYQQVLVVQQLINQHFPTISLIKCPTIREHNGLAKSSRNKLLSESAFNRSGEIYSTLKWIKENITAQSINSILDDGMRKLSERFEVEYLELRNENNLEETSNSLENSRLFVAVQIESIRLIDNIALN